MLSFRSLQRPNPDIFYVSGRTIDTDLITDINLTAPQVLPQNWAGPAPLPLWNQIVQHVPAWHKLREACNYLGQSLYWGEDRYWVNKNFRFHSPSITHRSK